MPREGGIQYTLTWQLYLITLDVKGRSVMVTDPRKTEGRVDGRRYCELPENHRTTLVVGMLDMLERMADYLGPKERAAFEPMLQYASQLTSGDLREIFDKYMKDDPTGQTCAIASNLLSMLISKSGVLK
jgi:hypothetical protein